MNVADPVIANQSPPLTSLGHGPGEDLYMGQDGTMLGDDSLSLQGFDWETKPVMTLPMRPPGIAMEETGNQQSPGPVAFLDPANLNNNPPM